MIKRSGIRLVGRGLNADREGASDRRSTCAFLAVVLFPVLIADACPLCKDSAPVSDARDADAVTDAGGLDFNRSIYGLLGGVTLAGGVVAVAMIKAGRAGSGG